MSCGLGIPSFLTYIDWMQGELLLAPEFLAHASADLTRSGLSAPDLEVLLQGLVAAGREAWPQIPLDAALFVRHLTRTCRPGVDPAVHLSDLHGEDLYLACGCVHQRPQAMQAFEEGYLAKVGGSISRGRAPPDFMDELRQVLRVKLLVCTGDAPGIATYRGTGSLLNWLRSAARRAEADLFRQRTTTEQWDDERVVDALSATGGPELDFIKRTYGPAFKQALYDALRALDGRLHSVLRLYYVARLNLAGIGAVLGAPRSTVHKWQLKANQEVFEGACRLLEQRCQLGPTEVRELAGLLRTYLEVSLIRALRESNEDED